MVILTGSYEHTDGYRPDENGRYQLAPGWLWVDAAPTATFAAELDDGRRIPRPRPPDADRFPIRSAPGVTPRFRPHRRPTRRTILSTTDAIAPEPIEVMIEPKPMRWARYVVGDDGEFADRGVLFARDGEPAVIELAGPPDARVPITYDSTTARTAAARLLGYARQLDLDEPLPDYILTTLLPPDTRTATGTTWELGDGLVLRYTAPFGSSLTAEAAEWTLTAEQAIQWARALLTLAAELDHAHAVAAQAILAQRTGTTPTENIRRWVTDLAHELTAEQRRFVDRLRDVLANEESIERGETLFAALDIAHRGLPTSLADLRLLSRETVTHLDAADVITQLADRYAMPIYLWTAASPYIRWEIGDEPLTEQEWLRLGRTQQMNAFESLIENEQDNREGLDIRLALYQAGVLCRECDTRITGEIATTLGRCDDCRPDDPADALAEALAAGCPGAPDVENYTNHFLSSSGPCAHCGLPLPDDYHLVLEAERAEQQQREAARRAAEEKSRKTVALALQLIEQDAEKTSKLRQRRERGELSLQQCLTLDGIRAEAAQIPIVEIAETYLRRAEALVEQGDHAAASEG